MLTLVISPHSLQIVFLEHNNQHIYTKYETPEYLPKNKTKNPILYLYNQLSTPFLVVSSAHLSWGPLLEDEEASPTFRIAKRHVHAKWSDPENMVIWGFFLKGYYGLLWFNLVLYGFIGMICWDNDGIILGLWWFSIAMLNNQRIIIVRQMMILWEIDYDYNGYKFWDIVNHQKIPELP